MTAQKGSLAGRMLWALLLGGGFGTVWLAIVMIGGELGIAQWRARKGEPRRGIFPESLIITTDGRALLRGSFVQGQAAGYSRLDGTPVEETSGIRQADSLQVWHMREPQDIGDQYFFLNRLGGDDWDWRLRAFVDDQHPDDIWYFIHDGQTYGAGYFAGFDKVDKRRIGFISDKGFSEAPPSREEWFPVERHLIKSPLLKLWTSVGVNKGPAGVQLDSGEKSPIPSHLVFVPSGKELKVVDLSSRTVRTVLATTEPIEGIRVAAHLTPLDTLGVPPASENAKEQPRVKGPSKAAEIRSNDAAVAAMTAHRIYVLNQDLRQRNDFSIPEEASGEVELYVPQGWAVALVQWEHTSGHEILCHQMLYRIGADGSFRDGKLVKSHLRTVRPWSERPEAILLPLAMPSPAVLLFVEPLMLGQTDLTASYFGGFPVMIRESGVFFLFLTMFAVGLAALAWRRSAAYSLSLGERLVWSTFVVFFGLGGYIGFLLHRRWPVREECPHCHAQTVLENGACVRCREGLPGPIFKGTEVFA